MIATKETDHMWHPSGGSSLPNAFQYLYGPSWSGGLGWVVISLLMDDQLHSISNTMTEVLEVVAGWLWQS